MISNYWKVNCVDSSLPSPHSKQTKSWFVAFGNEIAQTDDTAFGNEIAQTDDSVIVEATRTSAFPSPHNNPTQSWFALGAPFSRKQTKSWFTLGAPFSRKQTINIY